jgi:preprotein translocase subunit YajC
MLDFIMSSAYAQTTTAAAPAQSPFVSFIPFVLIFLVMYFLMIRPQKKRMQDEQNFISKLAHGDEVYTKSGILGKVTGIAEKVVTLELDGGARLKVLKTHIGGSTSQLFAEQKK